MSPILLAIAGATTALVGFGAYFSTIPRGRVPVRPIGTSLVEILGAGLAAAGLVLGLRSGVSLPVWAVALSTIGVVVPAIFFFLLSQRKTPVGALAVARGDRLLAFRARTSEGAVFDSAALEGQRVLLKFFRGFW